MKSSNLYFVSACTAYGARIIHTDRVGGRVTFELSDCPPKAIIESADGRIEWEYIENFEDLYLLFSSGRLCFPPKFTDAIQAIKSLIYNDR